VLDILIIHLLDICKRFKIEAALSYLEQKTGIILLSFCFGLFLHRRFIFIHSQRSRDERKCYIALRSEPNANALRSISVEVSSESPELPGQPLAMKLNMGRTCPCGIVDFGSGDKSTIDSWYHTSSDVLEHAAVTLNYSSDLLW